MNYSVKFEIYGKRMKTEIEATSKAEAMQKVIGKLIFHEIEAKPDIERDGIMEFLNGFRK